MNESEQKFQKLVDQWYAETGHYSLLCQKYTNPNYKQILELGKDIVPFILKELKEGRGHWFHALAVLAGLNVAENEKTRKSGREAWLQWGREQKYL